jgi:hypothetical protein
LSETQEHLVDLALARYIDWRDGCAAVAGLYREWCTAGRGARRAAFLDYRSTLENEERLAGLYAGAVARLEWALWPEPSFPAASVCEA